MQAYHLLFIGLATLVPACTLLLATTRKGLPMLGCLGVVTLQLFLGVTLKTGYSLTAALGQVGFPWNRDEHSLGLALLYYVVFVGLLCLGYMATSRRRQFDKRNHVSELPRAGFVADVNLNRVFMFATAVFLLTSAALLWRKGFFGNLVAGGMVNAIVQLLATKVHVIEGKPSIGNSFAFVSMFYFFVFVSYVTILIAVVSGRGGAKGKIYLLLTLLYLLCEVLIRSKRDNLVAIVIVTICSVSVFGNLYRMRTMVKASAVVIVFICIFAVLGATRGSQKGLDEYSGQDLVASVVEPIVRSTYFSDVNVLAKIIERSSATGILYGTSYAMAAVGFIPRDLWPEKPAISVGYFVREVVYQRHNTLAGFPPTFAGESFLNFSYFGVLMGFFLGVFFRKYDNILVGSKLGRCSSLFYIVLLPQVAWSMLQSSFALVFVGIVSNSILLALFYQMFLRERQRLIT